MSEVKTDLQKPGDAGERKQSVRAPLSVPCHGQATGIHPETPVGKLALDGSTGARRPWQLERVVQGIAAGLSWRRRSVNLV